MKKSQFVRFSKCLYLCTLSVESVGIEKLDLCAYESPCFVLRIKTYERTTLASKKYLTTHTVSHLVKLAPVWCDTVHGVKRVALFLLQL